MSATPTRRSRRAVWILAILAGVQLFLLAAIAVVTFVFVLEDRLASQRDADTAWTAMVSWDDVAEGACLGATNYFRVGDESLTTDFRAYADYYTTVPCEGPHAAEVLRRVPVPGSENWDAFGRPDGPSIDEAAELTAEVCDEAGVLLRTDPTVAALGFDLVAVETTLDRTDIAGLCLAVFDDEESATGVHLIETLSAFSD